MNKNKNHDQKLLSSTHSQNILYIVNAGSFLIFFALFGGFFRIFNIEKTSYNLGDYLGFSKTGNGKICLLHISELFLA